MHDDIIKEQSYIKNKTKINYLSLFQQVHTLAHVFASSQIHVVHIYVLSGNTEAYYYNITLILLL